MRTERSKINLLGLSPSKLAELFSQYGEKSFRATQVLKWIHQHGVTDFDDMSNISKKFREILSERAQVLPPKIRSEYLASDGCHKWIVDVESGSGVEMVFIPEDGRGTLCISSQAGCSLDCSFCATGKEGFDSNLSAAEIVGQLWLAKKMLSSFDPKQPRKITNVVFMGMGEPLLNFDNVIDAITLMMDDNCYGLSKRRVTISTSGVIPELNRLHEFTDVSLAVSLHAPNDELRRKLMPINKKYPLQELLDSVNLYLSKLKDNRVVTIEYILISGLNDHRQHARELAEILRQVPCKINLIPFNPFEKSPYRRSSNSAISNFRRILQEAGYTVTIRTTRGEDIAAACGQLVGKVEDSTKRSQRYIRLYDSSKNLPGSFA